MLKCIALSFINFSPHTVLLAEHLHPAGFSQTAQSYKNKHNMLNGGLHSFYPFSHCASHKKISFRFVHSFHYFLFSH